MMNYSLSLCLPPSLSRMIYNSLSLPPSLPLFVSVSPNRWLLCTTTIHKSMDAGTVFSFTYYSQKPVLTQLLKYLLFIHQGMDADIFFFTFFSQKHVLTQYKITHHYSQKHGCRYFLYGIKKVVFIFCCFIMSRCNTSFPVRMLILFSFFYLLH